MTKKINPNQRVISIDGEYEPNLTLSEFCRACNEPVEWVIALVEEGVLDPQGDRQTKWLFSTSNLRRALRAQRIQHDLGLNMSGLAVALDLLDEIDRLERKLNNRL